MLRSRNQRQYRSEIHYFECSGPGWCLQRKGGIFFHMLQINTPFAKFQITAHPYFPSNIFFQNVILSSGSEKVKFICVKQQTRAMFNGCSEFSRFLFSIFSQWICEDQMTLLICILFWRERKKIQT